MSKKIFFLCLWPVLLIFMPTGLIDTPDALRLKAPYCWEAICRAWDLWSILVYGWPGVITYRFAHFPLFACVVYSGLITALVWWFRRPSWFSGATLFILFCIAGPSGMLLHMAGIGHP